MSSSKRNAFRICSKDERLADFDLILDHDIYNMTQVDFLMAFMREKATFLEKLKDIHDVSFEDLKLCVADGPQQGVNIPNKFILDQLNHNASNLVWYGVRPEGSDSGQEKRASVQSSDNEHKPSDTDEGSESAMKKLTIEETKCVVRDIVVLFASRVNTLKEDDLPNCNSGMYKYDTRLGRKTTHMEACIRDLCDNKIIREVERAKEMCQVKYVEETLEKYVPYCYYQLTGNTLGCQEWYNNYGKYLEDAYYTSKNKMDVLAAMEEEMTLSVPSWMSGLNFPKMLGMDPKDTIFTEMIEHLTNGKPPKHIDDIASNDYLRSMIGFQIEQLKEDRARLSKENEEERKRTSNDKLNAQYALIQTEKQLKKSKEMEEKYKSKMHEIEKQVNQLKESEQRLKHQCQHLQARLRQKIQPHIDEIRSENIETKSRYGRKRKLTERMADSECLNHV